MIFFWLSREKLVYYYFVHFLVKCFFHLGFFSLISCFFHELNFRVFFLTYYKNELIFVMSFSWHIFERKNYSLTFFIKQVVNFLHFYYDHMTGSMWQRIMVHDKVQWIANVVRWKKKSSGLYWKVILFFFVHKSLLVT